MNNITVLLMFLILFILCVFLIFLLFLQIQNQRKPSAPPNQPKRKTPTSDNITPPKSYITDEILKKALSYADSKQPIFPESSSPKSDSDCSTLKNQLEKQFYRMLNGDKKAAMRLIDSLQKKYPNQSEIWYWEKAISDLERDRR